MKRQELEHVLRASASITTDSCFVVIGSQAVLLPYPDAPAELLLSNEVDLYPSMHPERADEANRLEERLNALDRTTLPIDNYIAWARRRAQEATA